MLRGELISLRWSPIAGNHILCDDDVRLALRNGIEQTRNRYPFNIDAWVLLPDHLHCI